METQKIVTKLKEKIFCTYCSKFTKYNETGHCSECSKAFYEEDYLLSDKIISLIKISKVKDFTLCRKWK